MNRRLLFFAICGIPLLAGCKKYLEHIPDSTWTELNTPAKVSQHLATAYPQSNYITFFEAMTDNVADKGSGQEDRINQDPFLFRDVQDNQQDSPEDYWSGCYKAIAAANNALEACRRAPNPDAYEQQKGEALVARAYAHFMLVNVFSKFYDASTAATDPGIPYVTEPETVVIKQYERKTVAYVYEQIEKDLLEGLPLIKDDAYSVPRYHFNRAAAYAFATRFYLFKKDYANTLKYAEQVFPNNDLGVNMRPWNTTYATMSPEQLRDTYAKATENANLLLVETGSFYGRYLARYRYALDYAHYISIMGYNVTGGAWAMPIYYYGTKDYFVPKLTEYFVKSSVNANIGLPYVMVPLFTTEEVLFNRAEANVYEGNTDAAIADLNLYASKRVRNYDAGRHRITAASIKYFYNTSDLKAALIRNILDFKRVEYVQEGMRWFDILRYKMPVVHYTAAGETLTLSPDDPHRAFQIPVSAQTSGIDLNPR